MLSFPLLAPFNVFSPCSSFYHDSNPVTILRRYTPNTPSHAYKMLSMSKKKYLSKNNSTNEKYLCILNILFPFSSHTGLPILSYLLNYALTVIILWIEFHSCNPRIYMTQWFMWNSCPHSWTVNLTRKCLRTIVTLIYLNYIYIYSSIRLIVFTQKYKAEIHYFPLPNLNYNISNSMETINHASVSLFLQALFSSVFLISFTC